ncbi:hypothetical protein BFJ67_g17707, partial [Fusarium oxysporum f. sp. cepae]
DPDKACNWGIPIDRPVLGEMLRPLAGIDISTCLEPETKEWCRGVLAEMGYDDVVLGNHQDPAKLRPFKRFYLALRDRIIQHIESRQPPVLAYRRLQLGELLNMKHYLHEQIKPDKTNWKMGNQQNSHLLSLVLKTKKEMTSRK